MNLIGITGNNIRELREARGWTQQKLAELLKVEIVTVSRWERALDQEASIKSTMYAVLLPILVSAGVRLSIAKELRNDWSKLFEKMANITAAGLAKAAETPVTILGGLAGALTSSSGRFAAKALHSWLRKSPDGDSHPRKPEDRLPAEVGKALLLKELADIRNLYLQQKEAWETIEKDGSLHDGTQEECVPAKKGRRP